MRIRALLLVCLIVLMSVSTALAQDAFVSPDEDWQVEVPRGFDVEVNDNGVGYVSNEDMEIQLYSPAVLEDLGYEDFDDPQDLVESVAETEDYEITEVESANSVRGSYITIFGQDDVGYIAIGKTMSDDTIGFALITIYEDAPDDAITEALDIVATFDVIEGSSSSNRDGGNKDSGRGGNNSDPEDESAATTELPDELRDFDADWEDAVAELEDEGVITEGGDLVFFEDEAFIAGRGANYTSLASRARVENVAMAGELTFELDGDEYQTCSLAARVQTDNNGTANNYLEFGVNSDGQVYVYDLFGDGDEDYAFYEVGEADPEDVLHYLVVISGETMAFYLNGELLATEIPVAERDGSFGVLLRGDGSDSRCEVNNTWAYEIPMTTASRGSGVCEATAGGDINKREGPGTNFDRAGQLRGGRSTEVIAQSEEDRDGLLWYQLDDETWVREDLVDLSGDCEDLPIED
jgi:hypothetical protein